MDTFFCAAVLSPEAMLAHEEEDVREAFAWLVLDEEHPEQPLGAAVVAFLEEHRAQWQPRPHEGMRVWFSPGSGVNAWSLLYEVEGQLVFLAYDQG